MVITDNVITPSLCDADQNDATLRARRRPESTPSRRQSLTFHRARHKTMTFAASAACAKHDERQATRLNCRRVASDAPRTRRVPA